MKFVVFVEGETERAVVGFLKRWLDERFAKPVGVVPVFSNGWADYLGSIKAKALRQLASKGGGDIVAAVGLLDLYGPTIYPAGVETVSERYAWAKQHIETIVGHPKFTQHFAVHESEAWLLGDASVLPERVQRALPRQATVRPETVDFDEPPAKLLERLYREKERRPYRKVIDGADLFLNASPERVYVVCPYLKKMLDEMLAKGKAAGL